MNIDRPINIFVKDWECVTKDATKIIDYSISEHSIDYTYDNGVIFSQVADGYTLTMSSEKLEEMINNDK